MTFTTNVIVYPEGDIQEIPHNLSINDLTDLNGYPLKLPIASTRVIVYRVFRISTHEQRGETRKLHFLELVRMPELLEFT